MQGFITSDQTFWLAFALESLQLGRCRRCGLRLHIIPLRERLLLGGLLIFPKFQCSVLQVDEMEKAVDVAESNMARFGLTLQDIQSRRKWVRQTRQQVQFQFLIQ